MFFNKSLSLKGSPRFFCYNHLCFHPYEAEYPVPDRERPFTRGRPFSHKVQGSTGRSKTTHALKRVKDNFSFTLFKSGETLFSTVLLPRGRAPFSPPYLNNGPLVSTKGKCRLGERKITFYTGTTTIYRLFHILIIKSFYFILSKTSLFDR